ncbi:MAG TPA: hypothetical protein VMV08_00770 [Gaiellaceae bacterium]|nr:hypothetical protein [Gaiellaceae bacterium]
MAGKADFTAEEWETVAHGPSTAGLIVITAQRGGVLRETLALTQVYVEARGQHGQSELLDEIVSGRPALDHTRYHSAEELRETGLKNLRAAISLLEQKATPEEIEAYKGFVLNLADRVANAHREHGRSVSDAEQAALDQIAAALTPPSS